MVDDGELQGLDPYALMAEEADRLYRFMRGLSASQWQQPSRCAGWSVRDVLAHLAASEDYNRASLDGTVQAFLAQMGAKGATDLATANELGIRDLDAAPTEQLLESWRERSTTNREELRRRDGGEVDSSVGAYPARWQAFHLAFELAIHADDIGVPVAPADARRRSGWQARFGRFALVEAKPEVTVEASDGRTRVRSRAVDVELPDEEFVEAVAARRPAGTGLDDTTAAVLSVTP
jgi:uncharacterized protein (TIGR03083 family)